MRRRNPHKPTELPGHTIGRSGGVQGERVGCKELAGDAVQIQEVNDEMNKKSILKYGHHIFLELVLSEAVEVLLPGVGLLHEDIVVLRLVLHLVGVGSVLLERLATHLHLYLLLLC